MPELPEVEVVRRGLAEHVPERTIVDVEVAPPARGAPPPRRATPTSPPGWPAARSPRSRRRGKYLWLELDGRGDDAVLAHLGMSGQMLVADPGRPDEKHLRIRVRFADDGPELRFVDQRTFGGLSVHPLVAGRRRRPRCPPRSRTSPATRWIPRSTSTPRWRASGGGAPRSSGRCWTRPSSRASATSTPTRRCGGPGCTAPARPRSSPGRRAAPCSTAATDVMNAGARRGRHVVRRPLRQRQRRLRLLRPLARRLRPGRPALPPLRHADPPGGVHEPRQLQLPALPAPAPRGQSQPFRLNATYSRPESNAISSRAKG